MDIKVASELYQGIERDLKLLIRGSCQKDAAKQLGVEEHVLAGFTKRLASINEEFVSLHQDIANSAGSGVQVRGPGRKVPD